ncbi:MAG: hypothetical protein Ct9H300mP11_04180 [Chloroflexota bacterium]|nr:MAG: hypothetical protein Ct9H300mP11_04180 [Chloroflexota bacterium]
MAATEPKGHGQHAGLWVFPDVTAMSRDVSEKTRSTPRPMLMALVATGILFILGIVGFVARAVGDGFRRYKCMGLLPGGLLHGVYGHQWSSLGRSSLSVHKEPLASSVVSRF